LQVGFQSQAHFTTVFKRLTGQPPDAWRRSRRLCA
jgi:AraC-like DNA-binding protein